MQRREFLQRSLTMLVGAGAARMVGAQDRSEDARRVLYVFGQFSQTDAGALRDLTATLGASAFNVLVLSFLQADFTAGKLALSYNGNDFSSLTSTAAASLAQLRTGFPQRKRVMLSIGGWNHTPTFSAIRSAGVSAFVRQLSDQVIAPLGLDGIDLDLEPTRGGLDQWIGVHREYGSLLVDLTNEYKRAHPAHLVTHAPISPIAAELYANNAALPGVERGLLAGTRAPRGNNIDWLNVQLYEGGAVADGDISGFYRDSLVKPLLAGRQATGVASPLHFCTPLFEPEARQPLQFCADTIAAIDRRCAGLRGGRVNGVALWDYRQVQPEIAEWSRGLQTALGA